MLNIEIDGSFCAKCKKIHPTLFWHQKYNDYLPLRKKRHVELTEKYKLMHGYLDGLSLDESVLGKCVICGYETNYKDTETENHVCSDECKYKNREKL